LLFQMITFLMIGVKMINQKENFSTTQPLNHSALTNPTVSVVMNCLNGEKYLREAIDSVYAQTYTDWEIIFWDNASTDKSGEITQSYNEKLRYFRGEKTVLLGAARNKAIEQAKGAFIAFLDCDDLWLPIKLEKQVQALENRPEVDFVYSNFFKFDPTNNRRALVLKGKQPDGNVFENLLYHYDIGIVTVMVRTKAFTEMDKLFDENLNLAEEYDVFMRFLYNSQAACLADPLAMHRVHPGMSTRKYWKEFSDEIAYVVKKLKNLDPNFKKKYSEALRYQKIQLEFQKAKDNMAFGHLKTARKHLSQYKWFDHKFFILYCMSYLPVRLWFFLRPFWTRGTFR